LGNDAWRVFPAGMPMHKVAEIIYSDPEGIAHAHTHGRLHRDVKPANRSR